MDEGDILRTRWIKPAARCSPSQVCGHLILLFSSQVPANDLLQDGLYICHKKVYVEKCKQEPLCCLNCHGWNHLATECPAEHATFGMCAQCHCMVDCTNLSLPHCMPCGVDGHTIWDRLCLVYKCNKMNRRMEGNQMPYFPTLEIWTQVNKPPKVTIVDPGYGSLG